jgi:hypothetical protein
MGMVLETTVDEDAYLKVRIEGSASVQQKLKDLCREYKDIFSVKVKKEAADVPPLRYDYNKELWRAASNRLPARPISTEKQEALSNILAELLALGVIRPSTATSWSQVNLVRKPKGGFRCTIDFRGINKAIVNQGWQMPNMSQMLTRI